MNNGSNFGCKRLGTIGNAEGRCINAYSEDTCRNGSGELKKCHFDYLKSRLESYAFDHTCSVLESVGPTSWWRLKDFTCQCHETMGCPFALCTINISERASSAPGENVIWEPPS